MKTKEPTHSPLTKLKPGLFAALSATALLAAALLPSAQAGTDDPSKKLAVPVDETPLGSKIHVLAQVDFGSAYITPRGLNVENQGVSIQPLVLIFWDLYSSNQGFLDDISLTTGVWNDWGTHTAGANPGKWNEIDPIVGLTFKFLKGFQFDAFLDTFVSQTNSYPTSNSLDLTLTYHDSFLGDFSLNPYVQYFYELHEKATVDLDPALSQRGYYFQLGVDPTYALKDSGIKFELPTYVSLVSDHFYQKFDGSGGGSGVGLFSTEFKVTVPLKFVSKAYGFWSVYAGFRYDYLNNVGLLDGNTATTTPTEHQHNLFLFHGGFNVFF